MKKILMLFACFGLLSLASVDAQNCKSHKSASADQTSVDMESAVKAATVEADIEKRVCEKSGKVSFVKKSTCSQSGKVSFTDVRYDDASGKFVNVSPSDMADKKAKKKGCTAAEKAACAKKASAVKTSGSATSDSAGKKACTAAEKAACAKKCSKAEKAACKAKKSAAATETSKVKLVSSEE